MNANLVSGSVKFRYFEGITIYISKYVFTLIYLVLTPLDDKKKQPQNIYLS